METETNELSHSTNRDRRQFVKQGLIVTLSTVAGIGLVSGCKDKEEKEEGEG